MTSVCVGRAFAGSGSEPNDGCVLTAERRQAMIVLLSRMTAPVFWLIRMKHHAATLESDYRVRPSCVGNGCLGRRAVHRPVESRGTEEDPAGHVGREVGPGAAGLLRGRAAARQADARVRLLRAARVGRRAVSRRWSSSTAAAERRFPSGPRSGPNAATRPWPWTWPAAVPTRSGSPTAARTRDIPRSSARSARRRGQRLWTYHAVAAVIRGHSLLLAQKEVDPQRIGLTGISWGGYLTCIVAGLDDRLKVAVPVYGCGFLHENSCWLGRVPEARPRADAPAGSRSSIRRATCRASAARSCS